MRSLLAFSSSFDALPGAFLGPRLSALVELLAIALDRCPVHTETADGLALGTSFLTDLTIYSLRSSAYALMILRYQGAP